GRARGLRGEGLAPGEALLGGNPGRLNEEWKGAGWGGCKEKANGRNKILGFPQEGITAVGDVRDLVEQKRSAFAAHVSQNDPNSPLQTMQEQIYVAAFGTERFVLARGSLDGERPETSLFDGV